MSPSIARWLVGVVTAVLCTSNPHAASAELIPLVVEERISESVPGPVPSTGGNVAFSSFGRRTGYMPQYSSPHQNGAELSTTMTVSDLSPVQALVGMNVTKIRFTILSWNSVPVTLRPHLGFWLPDWSMKAAGPGPWLDLPAPVAFQFDTLTVWQGATVLSFTVPPGAMILPERFFLGASFDNAGGTTGITWAQMNRAGIGLFTYDVVGRTHNAYSTHEPGSFFQVDRPPSTPQRFDPPGILGWEIIVDAPTPTRSSTWGRLRNLYK